MDQSLLEKLIFAEVVKDIPCLLCNLKVVVVRFRRSLTVLVPFMFSWLYKACIAGEWPLLFL